MAAPQASIVCCKFFVGQRLRPKYGHGILNRGVHSIARREGSTDLRGRLVDSDVGAGSSWWQPSVVDHVECQQAIHGLFL
jgi:hypothetical protein